MRPWLAAALAMCACRSSPPPLYPAGTDRDEGHGLLARASTQFMTDEEASEGLAPHGPGVRRRGDYGGATYGGAAYGGSTYAGYIVPLWPVQAPNRTPKYNQVQGLSGAIEGTIALRAPVRLATACGDTEPARAAVVYIERVQIGRTLLGDGRPASVGGSIVKRGCTLFPTVQFVTPLPAALAIHGDARPARVRVASKVHELQAGGRVWIPLELGDTRVDSDDGSLAAAWVIARNTPYYAITDANGRYRIDELAPGSYEVTIWQPPAGKLSGGALSYGEPVVIKRTVKVEARRATRLDVP